MADDVEITIDTTRAVAKFDRVPPAVRDSLRGILPPLIRQLAGLVNDKIATELKTRRTLTVAQEMHESVKEIYGVVRLDSPSAGGLLPTYLEHGTAPHEIVGNPILAFEWPQVGGMAFFRRVEHPGTRDYRFMEESFDLMRDEIVDTLREAAKTAAASVR